jgi:flagella basal body P-ring formation protein FlgA
MMIMRTFLIACALLLCSPAVAGIRVVVPNHDIARGATLTESDLTFSTTANDTMMGTVVAMSDVVGMQTRRVLRAGEMLRLEDLRRPVLVSKGSTVTMSFEAPGIVLTATGRAMSEGGMGENVTVQNPASYRQITAIVIGPGQVRAQLGGGRLASIQP